MLITVNKGALPLVNLDLVSIDSLFILQGREKGKVENEDGQVFKK